MLPLPNRNITGGRLLFQVGLGSATGIIINAGTSNAKIVFFMDITGVEISGNPPNLWLAFIPTFASTESGADTSISVTGGHIEFIRNWDALVPDQSITSRKLHNNSVETDKIKNQAVTPPKMERAFEYVDNAGSIDKDTTATQDYLLAYKQNQNLNANIAVPEQEDQWVHASFCLLYTSPSPRDRQKSRMPSSA